MTPEEVVTFLRLGVQHGASDIHFKVGDPPTYRVNGVLHRATAERLSPTDTHNIVLSLIRDDALRARLGEITEHDTSYSVPGAARFRVNIFRQRGTLCAVLRVIPSEVPKLETLGLPPTVSELALCERGMVLVTGATGSGKSTTLAAMVDLINAQRQVHVLTIEDPIEYLHANQQASVTQREIGLDTPSFNVALRAALRQDPDVILVGELRDAETVDTALKASETGHTVFSTMHTTDAAKTIARLVSYFPHGEQNSARYRLAENLQGTISQRLLRRADGRGRVIACEVMRMTAMVQSHVKDPERTAAVKDVIEKDGGQTGMQSFDQHLAFLFKQQLISIETAKAAATNAADFERNLYVSNG